MKNLLKIFLLVPALILSGTACTSTSNDAFVKGTVEEIRNGKDGYTAKIRTAEDEVYFATFSRANLRDPAQYKTVVVGETVEVQGDRWKMEEEEQITVREMR